MALTNLSQITTSGISTLADINLNNLTGVAATFTGNVTVGGTLTYDDVTNIDSVGLITARSGIRVLTGTATTALVVEGNARVTGILTVGSSSLTLDGTNNIVNVGTALTLGHTQGLQFHTQNLHSQGFEVNNVNITGIVTAGVVNVNGSVRLDGRNGSNRGLKLDLAGSGDYIIQESTTDDIVKFGGTGSSNFFTHNISSGKVGIGTDNPQVQLHLTAADPYIRFQDTAAPTGYSQIMGTHQGAIAFSADTSDSVADSHLRFDVDGTEALRIDSAGRLLLGTMTEGSSSADDLTVATSAETGITIRSGTSNPGNIFFSDGTSGSSEYRGFITYAHADDSLRFATTNTERFRITSDGKIVTKGGSAVGALTLAGDGEDITFGRTQNSGTGGVGRLVATGNIVYFQAGANASSGSAADLVFGAYGGVGEKLRIKSDGKIGIGGETSPEFKVTVYDAGYSGVTIKSNRTTATDNIGGLHFKTQSTNVAYIQSLVDGTLKIRNTSSLTERLRITSGGDICIGGHSSNYADSPLEVRGTNGGGDVAIRVTNNSTTTGTQAGIIFTTTTADYTTAGIGFERGDNALKFYVGQSAGGGGFDNATERLRITSDGRLGIGVNPSIVQALLNVKGDNDDGNQTVLLRLGNDSSGAGTGAAMVMGAGTGASSQGVTLAGFYDGTGTSFTVGTNASFNGSTTERLRISSDGTVSLGIVDTASNATLHIRSPNSSENTRLELSTYDTFNGSKPDADIVFTQQNGTEIAKIQCDTATGAANMADLTFSTNYGGLYERLRITKTGKVGVGEDSPEALLHVGSADSWIDIGQQSGNRTKIGFNNNIAYYGNSSSAGQHVWKVNNTRAGSPWGSGNEVMRIDTAGNLRVSASIQSLAGDTSISNLQSGRARIQRFQRGSNSNVRFSGASGYIGDMLSHAGPTMGAVFYMGGMTSSSSSTASANMLNMYYSGHWGQYTCVRIWMLNHYYNHGYKVWEIRHNGSPDVIIDKGATGQVTTTNTLVGSGTHGGQNVYRVNITCQNPGTYFDTRWYAGIYFGSSNGVFSSNKTVSQVDAHLDSIGSGVHFLTISDAALAPAPMYATF